MTGEVRLRTEPCPQSCRTGARIGSNDMNKSAFASHLLVPAAVPADRAFVGIALVPLRAENVPPVIIALSVPLAAALIALSIIDSAPCACPTPSPCR